jgi:hypothetical protein
VTIIQADFGGGQATSMWWAQAALWDYERAEVIDRQWGEAAAFRRMKLQARYMALVVMPQDYQRVLYWDLRYVLEKRPPRTAYITGERVDWIGARARVHRDEVEQMLYNIDRILLVCDMLGFVPHMDYRPSQHEQRTARMLDRVA